MSVTLSTEAKMAKRAGWVLRGTQYSGSTLIVFIYLADRSNADGRCWPSVQTIVDHTRCSERAVQVATAQLMKDGWLTVKRHGGPHHRSNLYQVDVIRLEKSYESASLAERQERLKRQEEAEKTRVIAEKSCAKDVEDLTNPVYIPQKPWRNLSKTCGNGVDDGVVRVQDLRTRGAPTAGVGCIPCTQVSQVFPHISHKEQKQKPTTSDGLSKTSKRESDNRHGIHIRSESSTLPPPRRVPSLRCQHAPSPSASADSLRGTRPAHEHGSLPGR